MSPAKRQSARPSLQWRQLGGEPGQGPADACLQLDGGEAVPAGGMGIARQLKDEIYRCPPLLVLTGRVQDNWLATWSRADGVVSHPLDPIELAETVIRLLRSRVPAQA